MDLEPKAIVLQLREIPAVANPKKLENQKIKKNLVLLSSRYELIRL